MERWVAKLISMALMFITIFICMALPIKVKAIVDRQKNAKLIVSLLRCFAGGVFLGTILTHMLPEVNEMITPAFLEVHNIHYPVGEVFVLVGFFFICFFERIVLTLDARSKKKAAEREAVAAYDNKAVEVSQPELKAVEAGAEDTAPKVEVTAAQQEKADLAEIRSIIFFMALSFECIFDGLSVGLQETVHGVWNMCIAVIAHEFIIAFCIGMELLKFHPPRRVLLASFGYAIIPPIGCTFGIILKDVNLSIDENALNTASGLLIAVAAGIFLSCTFIGMLGEELIEESSFLKLFVTLFGCSVMAALASIVPHEDDDIFESTTQSIMSTTAGMITHAYKIDASQVN